MVFVGDRVGNQAQKRIGRFVLDVVVGGVKLGADEVDIEAVTAVRYKCRIMV